MRFHVGGLLFTSTLAHGALVNRGDRSKLFAARKKRLARQQSGGVPASASASSEEPAPVRRNLRSLQGIGGGLKKFDTDALKKAKKGSAQRTGGKGFRKSETTAAMDLSPGVTLSDTEVEYGTPITATFEITAEHVSLDALLQINATNTADWEACVYQRMQNNDEPIYCIPANVVGDATVDEVTGVPSLDMTAEVTFEDTSATTLPEIQYGLGFDLYIQDENGVKVVGPGTFYLTPTPDMIAAADEEASARDAAHEAQGGIAMLKLKGAHFKGKHYESRGSAKKAEKLAKLAEKMTSALTKAALADETYTLSVGGEGAEYAADGTVVVTYDLTGVVADGGDRRELRNRNKKQNKINKGLGLSTGTDTTVAATTAASSSSTGTDATGTDATGSSSTTTTTTAPADPYEGADPAASELEADMDEPLIDDSDTSLWTIAVYDRMANPQGGSLPPHVSAPLGDLAGTWEFAVSGMGIADAVLIDGEFDVMVLNGSGDKLTDPVTFKVVAASR